MTSTNTRRWPRYHVHLPVTITANPETADIVVPGMVSELSRSGMEVYGGVNLQPGDMMEVEFRTSGRVRVTGLIRYRSGFCFGLEFCAVRTEPEDTPDALQSQMLATHEASLREMQEKINRSLEALEMRKSRKKMAIGSNATIDSLKPRKKYLSTTAGNRPSRTRVGGGAFPSDAKVASVVVASPDQSPSDRTE